MYDLLMKAGTVIDPAQGINGLNDVAVTDGKVTGGFSLSFFLGSGFGARKHRR